ncbi:MAG TPA: GNAT family N-acetyltransferase [Chloroflexia bacterium]
MKDNAFMNSRIQEYLRFAAGHGRIVERIGPFLATFTYHNDNPFLNYAIPDDHAAPSPDDVIALIAAYERRKRRPRLEYIATLAPAVEGLLVSAGFVAEGRLPLMVCSGGSERQMPAPEGIEFVVPATDDELLDTLMAQDEAYGDPNPVRDLEAATRLRASLADGMIVVLARVASTREPAGGGVCTVPKGGVTEIAGIGVREKFRRRGIAGALTSRLLAEAFNAGITLAFLMAAGEGEARIYARAGFTMIGDILHISRPFSSPR